MRPDQKTCDKRFFFSTAGDVFMQKIISDVYYTSNMCKGLLDFI